MNKPVFINGRFLAQQMTGIQRFSFEISKALIGKDPGIAVLAPTKSGTGIIPGDRIIRFGAFSGILWEQVDLPLFLAKHKNPLLINFGSPGPLFYPNRIVTVHDLSFYVHPAWFSKRYRIYYRSVTPIFTRLSKKVITVSEFSKSEIMKLTGIPGEKITIIHNAVSGAISSQRPAKRQERGKYILSVASMDPRKNLSRLADAYRMAGIDREIQLVIAGKPDTIFNMKLSEKVLAHSAGHVTDEELSSLYENALLFVYPSLYEGFGIPPLEAMSKGCPVILSDIPVFREVFGEAAHYVDPRDTMSICEGILHVLNHEAYRTELIRRGYERVKLYDWQQSADKLYSVISSVL